MSDPIRNVIQSPGVGAPVSTEEAQELKQKIQEALIEIRQAKDWDEYTTMDDQAEIELLEAKLKGTLTLINHFLATGEWGVPTLDGNGQVQDAANSELLRDLRPGWNGDFTPRDEPPSGLTNLFSMVGSQYPGAEFEGSIYIQDSGNPENPPQLVFQASENTVKIEAFNYGTNIVYVETYTDESGAERQRFWLGVDHVTNLNAVIAVSAHNLTHGIEMDFHRVFRIADGSHGFKEGTVGGIRFIGSDFNDTITGTQGDDDIIGLKGSDTLSGEGGIDIVSGDSSGLVGTREMAEGITAEMIREQLGLRNDIADGDDTIDGGAGTDILSGDGGVDTGFKTDAASGPYRESQTGIENQTESRATTPSETSWWVSGESSGWGNVRTVSRGVVEISETGTLDTNSELTIKMPDGFDYAYADDRDESIYITFVKHVDGQPPQTFTVIVRGALRDRNNLLSPFTLRFKGTNGTNIIDFHDIDMKNNLFKVEGLGSDDMILAPKNDLNKYGLELSDLIDPANRYQGAALSDELSSVVPDHDEEGPDGQPIHAVVSPDGSEIVISRDPDQEEPDRRDNPRSVHIDPSGYDRAYVVREGDDLKVILVRQGVNSSSPQTLVIRIDHYTEFQGDDPRDMSWLIIQPEATYSTDPESGYENPDEQSSGMWGGQVIYLLTDEVNGQEAAGNIIDAGAGNDFAFYHEGDTAIGVVESEVVSHYSPGSSLPATRGGDSEGGEGGGAGEGEGEGGGGGS